MSRHDLLLALVLLALIASTAGISAWLRSKYGWNVGGRKLLHLVAVAACASAIASFEILLHFQLLVLAVYPILAWLVIRKRWWQDAQRPAYGILWFPLAMLFLLWFTDRYVSAVCMGVLAVSDALAAWTGNLFARRFYVLTGDKKSWQGSLAFAVSALVMLMIANLVWTFGLSPEYLIFCALAATVLEAMGSSGRDNLFVPLGLGYLLYPPVAESLSEGNLLFMLFIAVGCLAVFRLSMLNASGAVAAWFMALGVLSTGEVALLLVPVLFLICGSLLGRLPGGRQLDQKAGRPRDHIQVWSNGAVAVLALMAGQYLAVGEMGRMLFLVSLATSSADTFSSELGARYGRKTWDILRMKPVESGLSGGMSWVGTLAAIPGAALIAAFAPDVASAIFILTAGFVGMCIDSIAGAMLQAKYANAAGDIAEEPKEGYKLIRGWYWLDNDRVNLTSNLLTVLLALLVLRIAW